MKARARHRIALTGVFVFLAISLPVRASGGVPEVNHVMVTDVTTRSFSVIWASSEASSANLQVYEDEDGTVPVTGAVITPHPVESGNATIATLAEDSGVMKIRVTGLSPNTTYYFKTITTSKSTPDVTYYPETAPFMSVTTELLTTRTYESGADTLPFSNDVVIKECFLEDGTTPAAGSLLLATVKYAKHPLTAFVGDGGDLPNALIDMNNFFSRDSSENLDLKSGENLTLVNFRGINGNSIITHEVPEDLSMCELKAPAHALNSGRNMVSIQLEPGNTDVETVLNPIVDMAVSLWAFDREQDKWIFYVKDGLPFLNELTDLHASIGFWLYMEDYASWIINGSLNNNPIQLKAGRNLVGFKSIESLPILEAIESIENELISVWNFSRALDRWIFYVKDGLPFLNELEYIEPGKAYWVYVSDDCQWQ